MRARSVPRKAASWEFFSDNGRMRDLARLDGLGVPGADDRRVAGLWLGGHRGIAGTGGA